MPPPARRGGARPWQRERTTWLRQRDGAWEGGGPEGSEAGVREGNGGGPTQCAGACEAGAHCCPASSATSRALRSDKKTVTPPAPLLLPMRGAAVLLLILGEGAGEGAWVSHA